jgi:hypothetical protein
MTTANHLTARDYFDQVLVSRASQRKAYLSQGMKKSGDRTFQQMLTAWKDQPAGHQKNIEVGGLTIVDYRKNPVRIKCRYKYRTSSPESDQNAVKPDDSGPESTEVKPNGLAVAQKLISGSIRRPMQLLAQAESASSPNQKNTTDSLKIEKSIRMAARKYNLSTGLLKGVIRAESNFQVKAVSHAGAQGLMQLMPGTAKELGVKNPFDIEQNIDGGARYLRKMLDNFGGDIEVALAAYNAGPGAVERYGGQIPPYQETEQYVERVLKFSKQKA